MVDNYLLPLSNMLAIWGCVLSDLCTLLIRSGLINETVITTVILIVHYALRCPFH